jgi:hypothetical protein
MPRRVFDMTVNRERLTLPRCKEDLDLDYITLDAVSKIVQDLIVRYGSSALIYEERPGHLGVFVQEAETDKEMAERIALEEEYAARRLEVERRQYEELKARFEEKP